MTKKERFQKLIAHFEASQPNPETELRYANPYELLVAVILSAQCTDKRVNLVTPRLFQKYPIAESLALADVEEVFEYIKSISYPNNKAKHLVGMAKILVDEFNSQVPATVDELTKMPGVGRKTANVIASVVHHLPTMAVDTHVFRVSHRLGLVSIKAKTPLSVEKELVKNFKDEIIPKAHHWLILHGRYVCTARSPKCEACLLQEICVSYPKISKNGIVAVDERLPSIN
jgi:endonuclease III